MLLTEGADIRMRDAERRTARDVADEFQTRDAWDGALVDMGLKEDGTEVRRPLNDVRLWISDERGLNGGAPIRFM